MGGAFESDRCVGEVRRRASCPSVHCPGLPTPDPITLRKETGAAPPMCPGSMGGPSARAPRGSMARKAGRGRGKNTGLAVHAARMPSWEVSYFPLPAPTWPSVPRATVSPPRLSEVSSFIKHPVWASWLTESGLQPPRVLREPSSEGPVLTEGWGQRIPAFGVRDLALNPSSSASWLGALGSFTLRLLV